MDEKDDVLAKPATVVIDKVNAIMTFKSLVWISIDPLSIEFLKK
jgi:hypothetical protein